MVSPARVPTGAGVLSGLFVNCVFPGVSAGSPSSAYVSGCGCHDDCGVEDKPGGTECSVSEMRPCLRQRAQKSTRALRVSEPNMARNR